MDSIQKKPTPDFIVRLVGPGIKPWAVPVRTLSDLLKGVQRLIDQRADDEPIDEEEAEPVIPSIQALHLVSVTSGSAAYGVAVSNGQAPVRLIEDVGRGIEMPEQCNWSFATLSSLQILSRVAKSLHCEVELRTNERGRRFGGVIAKITPLTYRHVAGSAFIHGETSIFARIERVGGATRMHCAIRTPGSPRKLVICRVETEALVRKLGRCVYQEAVLVGKATWLRSNWQLKHLVIRDMEPPKRGSIREALDRAYAAGGNAWDHISDPEAFLTEMR